MRNAYRYFFCFFTFSIFFLLSFKKTFASTLESTNYKILDSTFDSGGGIATSTNYKLLESVGGLDLTGKLLSTNYQLNGGFIEGIEANVPTIRCLETTTILSTSTCINFPNLNGAIGECGYPGCYDRAKLEINYQNNPVDTLYLVVIKNMSTNIEHYLQDNHTVSTSYDINDYMNICELEGKDTRTGSDCQNNSGILWNENLQRYNIFGLTPNTVYGVKLRAFSGNFTEVETLDFVNFTTAQFAISFDIDVASTKTETTSPHNISLGNILGTTATSTNRIWFDLNTNSQPGISLKISDVNNGLTNGSSTIYSTTEDLDTDTNGGFGAQISTYTQDTLGPVLPSSNYLFTNNQVGAISTVPANLFTTNNQGTNFGPVYNGVGSIYLKAKATINNSGGSYVDQIIFTLIPNI